MSGRPPLTSRPPRAATEDPCRAKGGGGDCCRPAVMRAYRELRERNRPDDHAFEAALTVYRWHHPEVAAARAMEIVSEWVWESTRH